MSQLVGENKFISAEDKESKVMKEIVEKQQFSTKVLITTKILDNGVSIVDPKLRNLVLETVDRTEFLQMLGRKRVTGEDEDINIFIPKFSKSYFSALLKKSILPEMEVVQTPIKTLESEIFRSTNIYKICRKYFDVVDGKWMLNPIASNRLDERRQSCETMLRKLEEDEEAFVKEQLSWLGIEERFPDVQFIKDDEKECAVYSLIDLLTQLRGKELDKEKQAEFRRKMTEMLKIICPERISHSQRMAGLSMINAALEQLKIEFRIISQGGKRKGEKSTWKITTL